MLNPITAYFNAQAESRRFRKQFGMLLEAVKGASATKVAALYAEVKAAPQYDRQDEAKLLRAALKRDDATVFAALFAGLRTPNYFFTKAASAIHPRGAMIIEKEHILLAAINGGSKNIALALARNPAVAINQPGGTKITRGYFAGGSNQPLRISLAALAAEKGMPEVAAAITARKPQAGPKI